MVAGTLILQATFDIAMEKGDGTINLYEVVEHTADELNGGVVTLDGPAIKEGPIRRRFSSFIDAEHFFHDLHGKYEKYASDIDWVDEDFLGSDLL